MALVERSGQRVRHPRAQPHGGGGIDAEAPGQGVGRPEPHAADVARQPVRVLADDGDSLRPVGPVDAHRPRGAHAVGVQEHHDRAHGLLLGPGRRDALGAPRAHPAHEAGSQVALDALGRGGRRGLQERRAELEPVDAVAHPVPRGGGPLARRHPRGVAHHGDRVAPAPGADPQHAEARLRAVEGHALHEARQALAGRGGRCRGGACRAGQLASDQPVVVVGPLVSH